MHDRSQLNENATDSRSADVPLLSVVTVCLNRADTIAAAIESLMHQLGPDAVGGDIEHLVVDGVSSDGTLDVIARYPHVRVVSEPDTGLYDAMNKGIRLGRGRYICFLNSDDRLADGVIAAIRPYLQASVDVVCVGTDFRRLRQDGGSEVIESIVAPEEIVLSPTTATLGSPLLNAKFFLRAFLVDRVGQFDLRYRLAADADLLLRAALANPRVAVLPIVGHHYIEHAGSLTINAAGKNGRRAAEECLAIADAKLADGGLPRRVAAKMRAWRGGKILAISNIDRRAAGAGPSWLAGLRRSSDVGCFAWYLLRRKLRNPHHRLADELVSMRQSGQDVWLLRHVFHGRRNGRFVEIGAYDRSFYSNCALMEGAYGWTGICIQPNPVEFGKLAANRTARALNIAVDNEAGVMKVCVAGILSGLVTYYEDVHKKRVEGEFEGDTAANVDVPVRDLASILKESGLVGIDYLAIDSLGGELAVIESLAASQIPVMALTIKNNVQSRALRRQLEALGMIKVHEFEGEDVFVRRGTLGAMRELRLRAAYMCRLVSVARRVLPSKLLADRARRDGARR